MHNRLMYGFVIFLMLFLSTVDVAMAGDNAPLSVSCSIPVVPGLNAPPFTTKTEKTEAAISTQQNEDKTQEQASSTIQEETQEEIMLADRSTSSLITQTIYLR